MNALDQLLSLIDAWRAARRAADSDDYADAWRAAKGNDHAAEDCLRRAEDYALCIRANVRGLLL